MAIQQFTQSGGGDHELKKRMARATLRAPQTSRRTA